jgi:hypothetical protein
MNIAQLRTALDNFPAEAQVLLARDEEWNTLHVKVDVAYTSGIYKNHDDLCAVVISPLNSREDITLF